MFSDYNCRLFDISKFDFLNSDSDNILSLELEKIKNDISLMTKSGFHTFYCPIHYNEEISTLETKRTLSSLKKLYQKALPRNCGKISVNFVSKLFLSSDAPYIKNISSLAISKSNYIFVELPLTQNPEYVPETLNKLLFQCKLIPIFTEFQLYNSIYDHNEIEKMLRINGSAFQFNIKNVCDPHNLQIINQITKNGNIVLLGSSCPHDSLNITEINRNMEKFKKAIGEQSFLEIILNAKRFLS